MAPRGCVAFLKILFLGRNDFATALHYDVLANFWLDGVFNCVEFIYRIFDNVMHSLLSVILISFLRFAS